MMKYTLTAVIKREDDGYVSLCSELDIASQGKTLEESRYNLIEALELFFKNSPSKEIQERFNREVYTVPIEVEV